MKNNGNYFWGRGGGIYITTTKVGKQRLRLQMQ